VFWSFFRLQKLRNAFEIFYQINMPNLFFCFAQFYKYYFFFILIFPHYLLVLIDPFYKKKNNKNKNKNKQKQKQKNNKQKSMGKVNLTPLKLSLQ
jgi:hypothetical protein